MTDCAVSVVVVSRGRPAALTRCLTALTQQDHPRFEIVVVADPSGIEAVGNLDFGQHLKTLEFDQPNISAARNRGIEQAAGEVIAFIDDDAVAEPSWLGHLVAPLARCDVAATGGFVRGRNGIGLQWGARVLDALGAARRIDLDPIRPTVLTPPTGHGVKTEGTNMAVRRDALVRLGGFDTAFHFYLDETDLNMRLGQAGLRTALVPLAEVHHGFAPSLLRRSDRTPRDLFDIGASWAVFQRKHVPDVLHAAQWSGLRLEQRDRLVRHLIAGTLEPRDLRRLMARLDAGYDAGRERTISRTPIARHPAAPFKRFPGAVRRSLLFAGRIWSRKRLMSQAAAQVRAGNIVTVIILSPTALFHRISFHPDGFWLHQGGMFGKSDRSDPLVRFVSHARRIERERDRVARQRLLAD